MDIIHTKTKSIPIYLEVTYIIYKDASVRAIKLKKKKTFK